MTGFQLRYFGPIVLGALCLILLCTFTAVSLLTQQATVTQVLRENVNSRRAAVELEECLTDLIALENNRVEQVSVLHDRVHVLLNAVEAAADQPAERDLHQRLLTAFTAYLKKWQALPPISSANHDAARRAATDYLEAEMRKPCESFIHYNGDRIEESAEHHEGVLYQLAWGMAVIVSLGGIAGVVVGFGVARGLARSIRRLRVQIRDAAGKLGPAIPEIVLTEEGDFHGLHVEINRLSDRIEHVVSTLQQRESEVLRAEQLAAVGQLAAGVGHEIRNPLTSIKLLVQAGLEDSVHGLTLDDLKVIEGEVRRIECSLQTFLNFAKPPKAERRLTNVNPLIQGVVDLVRGRSEKQRVTVKVDVPVEGLAVTADSEQLRQVIVNLCLNALDAMPTGGTLSLVARQDRNGQPEVVVSDTGPGITKTVLPKLFMPFFSTKDTGLGLGLVISKRIVEDHGGTLHVENGVRGGASFSIQLPAEPPEDSHANPSRRR